MKEKGVTTAKIAAVLIIFVAVAGVGLYALISRKPAVPESYQLTVPRVYSGILMLGPEENWWAGGLCYLGSFAMLVEYENSTLDFSDVVAYGGIGTRAERGPPWEPSTLGVGYMERSIINAASNLGYDLTLGIGAGGKTDGFAIAAAQTKTFNSQDEAFNYLKCTIASNIPVEVHLDLYYVVDDFAEVSERWAKWTQSKRHASHFMVVTGYDATQVYLNDPTEADNTVAVNMPATVDHFLQAWSEGANKSIQGARLGPYWMIHIERSVGRKSIGEIKSWNKEISENSAAQIRAYAAGSPSADQPFWPELAKARKEFAVFLQKTGSTEAAALYKSAAELYRMMSASGNVSADLNIIADLEENARQLY